MTLLQRLIPVNLLEEKEKFMADQTYNPQFIYEEPVPADFLTKYGQPQQNKLDLAKTIVDRAFSQNNATALRETEGRILSQDETERQIKRFLRLHQLEDRFNLTWSSSFVIRTSISSNTIKLRHPAKFRQDGLLGMLYHEIGTHILRRINYEQQPWYKKKKKYGFQEYLFTEEGLAILNGLLPKKFQLAYKSALKYLGVAAAQEKSFAELWSFFEKYADEPSRRWGMTFRQKRGLEDTSQPGGFTKDITYFEGLVDVWRYLKSQDFNPTELYYGKLAYQDVDKARQLNPDYQPILPSFYLVDPEKYAAELAKIGRLNYLD